MKRIEIDCSNFKDAVETIEKAGWKILRHPNHPATIHIEADKITLAQARTLAATFGKTDYQEIDDGKRSVKAVPRIDRAVAVVRRNKGKAVAISTAIAAAGAAYFFS